MLPEQLKNKLQIVKVKE